MNWLVPALTTYAPVTVFVCGFLVSFVGMLLVVSVAAWRLPDFTDMHWTEKARLLVPYSGVRSFLSLFITFFSCGFTLMWLLTPFSVTPMFRWTFVGQLGVILGVLVGRVGRLRDLVPLRWVRRTRLRFTG